jgi:hypothetical protein
MTDYTKSTNFATKDTLSPGSALKIVRGTEIDTEFNNIATAVATKADLASPALTGTPTAPTASAGDNDTSIATTAFVSTAVSNAVAAGFGFKNRIINGAMVIDQRNAGASVSLTSGGGNTFLADRWYVENNTDGTATIQQVSDAPTGFSNSIKYTVTAADSSLASDQSAFMQQRIEGFNFADLLYGTASALTVTVSFWVKSSVTGVFGVTLANNAYNRGYPASFTINAANTWEQKTATIAGDTTGTWIGATNGVGVRLSFGMAAGSARVAASGAWSASTVLGVSSQVNLMATNGATFQVSGVQLEKGSTATSFDYRPYDTELALCQRYCWRPDKSSDANNFISTAGAYGSTTNGFASGSYPVTMRTTPSLTTDTATLSNYAAYTPNGGAFTAITSLSVNPVSNASMYLLSIGVASGGTAGQFLYLSQRSQTTFGLFFSAEL